MYPRYNKSLPDALYNYDPEILLSSPARLALKQHDYLPTPIEYTNDTVERSGPAIANRTARSLLQRPVACDRTLCKTPQLRRVIGQNVASGT